VRLVLFFLAEQSPLICALIHWVALFRRV